MMQQLIRSGIVSSVDAASGTVRVTFPDRDDMVSGPLPVLRMGGIYALPGVGVPALCLFLGDGLGAGYYLGTFYADGDTVPAEAAAGAVVTGELKVTGGLKVTGVITHGGLNP